MKPLCQQYRQSMYWVVVGLIWSVVNNSLPAQTSRLPEAGLGAPIFVDEPTQPTTKRTSRYRKVPPSPGTDAKALYPQVEKPAPDRYLIDLPTALRLAGANNLQIALAAERVNEAQARFAGAKAAWLPSLNVGAGYNMHDGQIQDTRGQVIDVNRNSLFVGGGPVVGGAFPTTGGSGGPGRLAVDFSLVDGLFEPLAKRQLAIAADASQVAVFNDTLLLVAMSYLDLARAQAQEVIAKETERNAKDLVKVVNTRIKAGKAPPADGLRAAAERDQRTAEVFEAQEIVRVASAQLVQLLRLDPTTVLFPVEKRIIPIALIDENVSLPALIATAQANRPEIRTHQALADAAYRKYQQEKWRPFIPNVHLRLRAGGYGGGASGAFRNFGDRTDFDALLIWQVRNLGFGNRALRRQFESRNLQAVMSNIRMQDIIAAEVASAHAQVEFRGKRLDAARNRVASAAAAIPLNFKGVLGDVLRAIEAQQAIQALAAARANYLTTIVQYNRAQFLLLRALGRPVDSQGR